MCRLVCACTRPAIALSLCDLLSISLPALVPVRTVQAGCTTLGEHVLQSGDGSSFQQAESWVASASAWATRLLAAFPLYKDLLQPVALAVHEMCAGLALLVCAQKGIHTAVQDQQMGLVVAQLGALTQWDCHKGAKRHLPMSSRPETVACREEEHGQSQLHEGSASCIPVRTTLNCAYICWCCFMTLTPFLCA